MCCEENDPRVRLPSVSDKSQGPATNPSQVRMTHVLSEMFVQGAEGGGVANPAAVGDLLRVPLLADFAAAICLHPHLGASRTDQLTNKRPDAFAQVPQDTPASPKLHIDSMQVLAEMNRVPEFKELLMHSSKHARRSMDKARDPLSKSSTDVIQLWCLEPGRADSNSLLSLATTKSCLQVS